MELDISSLWTWTIPLWGMFVLVLFLTGILSAPVVLQGIAVVPPVPPVVAAAGGRRRTRN